MSRPDPFAKYGGKADPDPFAAYGGKADVPALPPSLLRSRMDLPLQPQEIPASVRFGGSLADALTGLAAPVLHPIDTATALTKTALPIAQSLQKAMNAPTKTESFGHALAAVTPMVGPIAEQIGEQAKSGDIAGAAGSATGSFLLPESLHAAPLLGDAMNAAAKAGAERWYESALKPAPRSNTFADVKNMVQTGLSEKIPVSESGLRKANSLTNDLNQQVEAEIASQPNATVNKFKVASRLNDTAKKFANQVNPSSDLNAISESGNEFLGTQPADIPATDAQALKKGTYRTLKDKSFGGELKSSSVEAQKSLARGLKEELDAMFPNVKDLNARQGRILNLTDDLEAAVNRNANHNLMGFGTPLLGGAVDLATGHPGMAVGSMALKEFLNPARKSRLAILLNSAAQPLP